MSVSQANYHFSCPAFDQIFYDAFTGGAMTSTDKSTSLLGWLAVFCKKVSFWVLQVGLSVCVLSIFLIGELLQSRIIGKQVLFQPCFCQLKLFSFCVSKAIITPKDIAKKILLKDVINIEQMVIILVSSNGCFD